MDAIRKIMELIQKAMDENFWGEVVIKFKDGKPVLMTTVIQTKL